MNNQLTTVPTTTITPRALRKIANELIDVHAGKPSTTTGIDYASIGAIAGIREMCEATMDAVRAKDPTRVSQGGDIVLSGIPWSTVRLGEQKAGTIMDIGTGIVYDLILLPGESEDLTWAQAKALVTESGGDLPSGAEMLMLERLLGAAAFKSDAYWTIETVRFEGDDQDSIQYFSDGCFDFTEPNDQMSVLGVRRVMVDDGIGSNTSNNSSSSQLSGNSEELANKQLFENIEELQPSGNSRELTVKLPTALWHVVHAACAILESENVPAHFEAAGALRTAMSDFEEVIAIPTPGSGPDLSDRPDLQAMRAALFEKVEPVTMEAITAVLDELNGIMDADDEGDTIKTLAPVIKVINGLILIADPEKLTGQPVETNTEAATISQQLHDSMRLDPALLQPKVSIQEVAELLGQLDEICDKDVEDDLTALRRLALHVIGGLLAHAGAEVLA